MLVPWIALGFGGWQCWLAWRALDIQHRHALTFACALALMGVRRTTGAALALLNPSRTDISVLQGADQLVIPGIITALMHVYAVSLTRRR